MLRSTDRIRTSHAGALEQPESLREVIRKRDEGQPYDQAAFDTELRTAVAAVVKRQSECGLDSVCDGEFGKQNFTSYVGTRISGYQPKSPRPGDSPLSLSFSASGHHRIPGLLQPTGGHAVWSRRELPANPYHVHRPASLHRSASHTA